MRRVWALAAAVGFSATLFNTLAPSAQARQGQPGATQGCFAGRNAPGPAAARWHPRVDATLYYRPGEFTREELRAFGQAVADWRAAFERRGGPVRLLEAGAAVPSDPTGEGVIVVARDARMAEGLWGEIHSTNSRGGYITAAVINVSAAQHKSSVLRRVLAHELGHAFGLSDCPSCERGSTVMALFQRTTVNGLRLGGLFDGLRDRSADGPTRCDEGQSAAGYMGPGAGAAAFSPGAQLDEHGDRAGSAYEEREWESLDPRRLDTSAPETGEGRTLIEGPTPSKETEEGAALKARLLAREAETMDALKRYTFTREVVIETLGADGRVTGEYRRVSKMLLADDGRRVERLVSFPKPTLKRLRITKEDLEDLAGAQLLGLEVSSAGRYVISFEGREELNGRRCVRFRVTPADLARAKAEGVRVFYGTVWADEETFEIVRARGRALPEGNQRFPAFEVRREPSAERLMFPARAFGEDTLVFPQVSIRMRLSVRYTDFKKFVTGVKIIEDGDLTGENEGLK